MATVGAPAPVRPRWWRELMLIAGFYAAYTTVRDLRGTRPVSADRAFGNARLVIAVERRLGVFHEAAIQHYFLHFHLLIVVLDVLYGSLHFIVTAAVLIVLFFRFPQRYRRWRNTLALATVLALLGFAFFPLMPPRLLPGRYGFVDTLHVVGGLWDFDSGPMTHITNQYAAMPSLHFSWSLWSAAALLPTLKQRWSKALAVTYPAVTLFCVVITANHFFVDVVAGAVIVVAGYVGARWVPAWTLRRSPGEPEAT